MSVVNACIEIPGRCWFSGNGIIRPQDNQLCIIIPDPKVNPELPCIVQYREKKKEFVGEYEIFNYEEIDRWTPLDLPEYVEKRVIPEIDKWFKEKSEYEN